MKTIWKFPIKVTAEQKVKMPFDSKIIAVQVQHGEITLWAEVLEQSPPLDRTIEIFGTGHRMSAAPRNYIGTVQTMGGSLVWHVYERT